FGVGDLALFLPTKNPGVWAAFNVNSPHHFLLPAESEEFKTSMINRDWILARLTQIDAFVADSPQSNPFGLETGCRYWVCKGSRWEGMPVGVAGRRREVRKK
ncbi:oligomeric, coiled-coil, peripheral membrane protein, partial [Rhizophlyctis rosea]